MATQVAEWRPDLRCAANAHLHLRRVATALNRHGNRLANAIWSQAKRSPRRPWPWALARRSRHHGSSHVAEELSRQFSCPTGSARQLNHGANLAGEEEGNSLLRLHCTCSFLTPRSTSSVLQWLHHVARKGAVGTMTAASGNKITSLRAPRRPARRRIQVSNR